MDEDNKEEDKANDEEINPENMEMLGSEEDSLVSFGDDDNELNDPDRDH